MEAPPRPRLSGLIVASLALSALSLLAPSGLGPLGPAAGAVLAFLGHRAVRRSGGALRGAGLARVAMAAALLLLLLMTWQMVRHRAEWRAQAAMAGTVAEVQDALRGGSAETAWALLEEDARAGAGRAAGVAALREALLRLGPLETVGDAAKEEGGWERAASFGDGARAALDLPLVLRARFRGGPARIRLLLRLRREGDAVSCGLRALRVDPGP